MIPTTPVVVKDGIANPAPLGLCAFGMTTVLLNIHNAGFYELNTMILGMGIFYTLYYVAMAVLPSVAGWSRSAGGGPAAPLFFASAILLLAAALIWSFNRLFARP